MVNRRQALAGLSMLAGGAWIRKAEASPAAWLTDGQFRWTASPPLIEPVVKRDDPCHAIKDPSVVFHDGLWHVFATIRSRKRTHQIEYVSFPDWQRTAQAERTVLSLADGYFCAPQVLWFTPHSCWYLIYQVQEPARKPALQPAYSTSSRIHDPHSWSRPKLLFAQQPENIRTWIDFWTISDDERMHLFFTSLDGRMWRSSTRTSDFPHGWTLPTVVLEDDIFEASHTYRLQGVNQFLTLVEAQGPRGRRYYKAYVADRLDGRWTPLAATLQKPFAAPTNVRDQAEHWTDSFSHGELLRVGRDERLEVDPHRLEFLFQGVSDRVRQGKVYGDIPWKLGLLRPLA